VGTPGYLSPEQVTGRPPTPAADVYALGLLVLESRTGETPFPGPAAEAASARLVRDPDIPESLGTDWVALLRAMTAREAADRPSALDVAVAAGQLDRATDGAGPATAPTIAIADVAAAPTMAVDGHAASVAPATADGAAPDAAAAPVVETAATRVLPAPDRSFFAAPVAASQQPEGRARARERERSADGERRWVRPTIAIALLVTIGVVVFTLLQSALSTPATNTTPEPLPSVPGDLGVHLEQLDEAVSGG
jgi:hypothetical protein